MERKVNGKTMRGVKRENKRKRKREKERERDKDKEWMDRNEKNLKKTIDSFLHIVVWVNSTKVQLKEKNISRYIGIYIFLQEKKEMKLCIYGMKSVDLRVYNAIQKKKSEDEEEEEDRGEGGKDEN